MLLPSIPPPSPGARLAAPSPLSLARSVRMPRTCRLSLTIPRSLNSWRALPHGLPAGNICRTLDFLLGRPPAWFVDDTDICLLDRNATRHRPCCFPLLICAQSQFGSGLCPGSRTHSSPGLHGRRPRRGRDSRFACRLKTSPTFRDRHRNPADAIGSGAILGNAWIGYCGHWPYVRDGSA